MHQYKCWKIISLFEKTNMGRICSVPMYYLIVWAHQGDLLAFPIACKHCSLRPRSVKLQVHVFKYQTRSPEDRCTSLECEETPYTHFHVLCTFGHIRCHTTMEDEKIL